MLDRFEVSTDSLFSLLVQLLSIWGGGVWVLTQRLGHNFVACQCVWFPVLFCWYLILPHNVFLFTLRNWGHFFKAHNHSSHLCLSSCPSSFAKAVWAQNFYRPSIWAWPCSEETWTVAAFCLSLTKWEPRVLGSCQVSFCFISTQWRWTQEVGKLFGLVLSCFETISSSHECSIEFSASSLLFLGSRPIPFCGYDFINLLAQKMKSWKKILLKAGKSSVSG